ncbi:MAG: sensor histidine kinase [Vicinamibacterales bacterium]
MPDSVSPPSSLPSPAPGDIDQLLITLNRLALSGAFVSGLAHELNNPLQVVNGTVELLLARSDIAPDVRTKLERVANQVHRASGTILDVLGFVRDRTAVPVRVDIRTVIDQVMTLRRYPLTRAGITATVEPPAAGAAILMAKPVDVAQVLLNLLMNAEAALAGGTGGEIGLTSEVGEGVVRVRVQDNGPGIAADQEAGLFEPFQTSHGLENAAGLGLAAAAALTRRLGGRIWRDPVPTGTAFVVELPLKAG